MPYGLSAYDQEQLLKLRELQALGELIGLTVYKDKVIICGQSVLRPPHIAPSQWLALWELTA